MKKIILLGTSILFSLVSYSQYFSDNFDSYNSGDYLVSSNPAWDTWSGGAGTNEDVKISSTDAASAPNSLYFKSNAANGGPTDIILRFDDVYTSGNFSLNFNIHVLQNKGAYFNLQQNHNVGEVWAIECHMLNNGTIRFSDGSGGNVMLTGSYPNGQWFNLKMDINLTTNQWEIFIDNNSIGVFSNAINSIGIWDIYPANLTTSGGNGQSEFYIDDVSYSHTPATLPPLNAGVTFVDQIDGIVGQNIAVKAKVRNLGVNPITSFDVRYEYAGGTPVTETVNGLTLASFSVYEHTFTPPVTLVGGSETLTVTVSNVNGAGQDADNTDDSKSITINPVVPAYGKIVVGEEATGTWCQYCPRGAVFMDYMANKYDGFWAGIAVHNNDPMADPPYDSGLGAFVAGRYPSLVVDRKEAIDPSDVEIDFMERILVEPKAIIKNGASFDSGARTLDVTLTYSFLDSLTGSWKVACALTEDDVTGTGSGYAQSNAYAGGGMGVMGGFESLPNPVPASQIQYGHVARKIAPSFGGDASLLPSSVHAEDVYTVCFTFVLPQNWNETKMHIVGMLINPSGKIDNGSYTTIDDAINNGIVECGEGTGTTSIEMNESNESIFNLYPNPTNGMAYIDINGANGEEVVLTITDISGKTITNRSYNLNGDFHLPINTNNFANGTYIVHLQRGGVVQQKKLIVR